MSEIPAHERPIRNIIAKAGGPPAIAEALAGKVKTDAVYKWPKIGIPDRHWPTIMQLSGASAADMLAANNAARYGIVSRSAA